ncbi:MAG: response regulator [Proteobacteria bacterium]|nr:response regulator [Pseudomonadota bacterium]
MPNKTILFADDSATMRTVIEKTFLAEPYDVVVVPSGEVAITKARGLRPDIVIADGGLVGVSGYDVCKAVRGDTSLSSVPVIIMSGVSNPYDESQGKAVGANGNVKKPFDTSKLIEQVGELVEAVPEPVSPPQEVTRPSVPPPRRPAPALPKVEAAVPNMEELDEPVELIDAEPIEEIPLEPEPVELKEEEEIEPDAFQVSTLAEMAQMDEQGTQQPPDTDSQEVQLTSNAQAAKKEPAKQLPIEEAIQEQALAAAENLAQDIEGVSADQLETIKKLTAEVIEKVVWEVVPELAETIIKEEISKLLEE